MIVVKRAVAILVLTTALVLVCASAAAAAAQPPVNLGTSASYALLARRGITNTGTTSAIGDGGIVLGATAPVGITLTGVWHLGDAAADQALLDAEAAYADALARTPATTIPGTQIGNRTLLPGVYEWTGQVQDWYLDGTLTLDAQGDPNAAWVFQCPPVLHANTGSRVDLINGARFCRVFWQTHNADLQPDSHFAGHILAADNIDMGRGATMRGQLLAIGNVETDGNITLDSNAIDNSICATWTPTPRLPKTGYPPAAASTVPRQLVVCGLGAMLVALALAARSHARERTLA